MERQKKSHNKLNVELSLKLIEAVKKRTLIWNRRSQHHRNVNRLHHAWIAIAAEVGLSAQEAKLLWKNLLAGFRVYKAKVMKSQQTGSGNDEVYKPNWFAYSAMLFLLEGTNAMWTSDTTHANAVVCRSIDELMSKSPIASLRASPEPEINEMELQKKTSKKLNVGTSFKLIEAVKKRPLLWDSSHQNLKNKTGFHHEWPAIAAEVNLPVEEAKTRWKHLLASFRVYKTKVMKSQQTGSVYHPVWFAYSAMLFMWEHTNGLRTTDTLPQDDSLKEEETDSETVTLVNVPNNTLVCKSIDEIAAKPPETSPSTCPKPQTQVGNALQIDPRRSQPWIKVPVRVVRTMPTQMEDPLQIKPTSQTQLMQVGTQANTFLNRRSLEGSASLLKSFVNLIEHELAELPRDFATMAQVDIYKIIGEYKLKDVNRQSTLNAKSAASKPMNTKVVQETARECSVSTSIKIEPSNSLETNDMLEDALEREEDAS